MFVAGMLVVAAGGSLFSLSGELSAESTAASPGLNESPVPPGSLAFEEAFLRVSEAVNPAVVQILSSKRVSQPSVDFFGSNPMFEDFFNRRRGQDRRDEDRFQLQHGLGSGAIIRQDGYIVTNRHVIADADELEVMLLDGRLFSATVVGSDHLSDIAVIRIEIDEVLPYIDSGEKTDLRVGQWVLAFGSPLSARLSNTVTAGIVSALGRFSHGNRIQNFIQTDAAINPGNSGGPLLNLRGEVIGINTAIVSDRPSNLGIGFAVPINTVRQLLPQLRTGKVTRGLIGVSIMPVTKDDIEDFGLDDNRGAIVQTIAPNGPADNSDLKLGDVIVSFNGDPVEDVEDLQQKVVDTRPGTVVELGVYRGGEPTTLPITIGELDLDAQGRQTDVAVEDLNTGFGMSLQDLTAETARELGIRPGTAGAVVTGVDPAGTARNGGVRPNDLIIEVNREPVSTAAEAIRELNRVVPGRRASLLILRDDSQIFLRVRKE